MTQVWIDHISQPDLTRLSYGLLLAFLAATVIGNLTAVFVLHFTMVWAAGYLGYYLALHRLDKGWSGQLTCGLAPPAVASSRLNNVLPRSKLELKNYWWAGPQSRPCLHLDLVTVLAIENC
jgi:hypothetical protein